MADRVQDVSAPLLLCAFRLADHWFGVEARWVKEVSGQVGFTPAPHAPLAVRGYVNLRGTLVLALDLRRLWMNSAPTASDASYLLVFKPAAGESFALVADEVAEIASVDGQRMENAIPVDPSSAVVAPTGNLLAALTIGFAKLPNRLVTVLDPRRMLDIVFAESTDAARLSTISSHPQFQVGGPPDA